ncbi:zonadhesin-like [Lineus longissimus]|uniref:zonadhesin-like n=1 Tax=Lineus longissimus TaxID=88925 RepID=UPI00315DDB71
MPGGIKIKLDKYYNIYKDGAKENFPLDATSINGVNVKARLRGKTMTITVTECGITLTYKNSHMVYLKVDSKRYGGKGKLTGMCDDCDGVKTPTAKIDFNNYRVNGNCKIAPANPKCPKTKKRILMRSCSIIQKKNGPFKNCIKKLNVWKASIENCIFDSCEFFTPAKTRRRAVCQSIEAFAQRCRQNGFPSSTPWRKRNFCPMTCPKNSVYKRRMNPCQPRCPLPRTVKRRICKRVKRSKMVEGCKCKNGYVLSGTACVKKKLCGCYIVKRGRVVHYMKKGQFRVSSNCKWRFTCRNGKFKRYRQKACHRFATCKVNNITHRYGCNCKSGYYGNGFKCKKSCRKLGGRCSLSCGSKSGFLGKRNCGSKRTCCKKKTCRQVGGRCRNKCLTRGRYLGRFGCKRMCCKKNLPRK